MTFRTWHLAVVAAAVLTGCAELATDESAATDELSVLNWSNDIVFHTGVSGSSEPAIAGTGGAILVVWPNGGSSDHTYLFWMFRGTNGLWSPPTEMSPRASSTARPTLVAFNGFYYVFYASGVDQYYARFDPQTRGWTGSSLLPFSSLGAVAAIPYNGSLALIRVDPTSHQLMMRTMSTAEVFSAEQAVSYNTLASDPCRGNIGVITGSSVAAPAAAPAVGSAVVIGFNVNDTSDSTPALAVAGSCLFIAHRNGTTSTLVYNTFNGSWGPLRTVTAGAGGGAQASAVQPAIISYASTLQMVYVAGGGSSGALVWTTYDGTNWAAPLGIPNHQGLGTPTLAPAPTALLMLHEGATVDANGPTNIWSSTFTP